MDVLPISVLIVSNFNAMPPSFNNQFTTKAKEAIKKAHELVIERGQNHVSPLHLLTALIVQDESMVASILDRMEVDVILLTDSLVEAIDSGATSNTVSPSYQIYLTPEMVHVLDYSPKA